MSSLRHALGCAQACGCVSLGWWLSSALHTIGSPVSSGSRGRDELDVQSAPWGTQADLLCVQCHLEWCDMLIVQASVSKSWCSALCAVH